MKKILHNKNGLTLVEVMVTILLISIISITAFRVLTQGTETSKNIQQETLVRDEADIILAQLVNTLYTTKQSHIIFEENNTNSSLLKISKDLSKCIEDTGSTNCINSLEKTGFLTKNDVTKLFIKDGEYLSFNDKISIMPTSSIIKSTTANNLYNVKLDLKLTYKKGNKTIEKIMTFTNSVQTINDEVQNGG